MKKHRIISIVVISVFIILVILFILKKEGVFEKNDINYSVMNMLYTLEIKDVDSGYEQFLKSISGSKKEIFTKEKYIELKKNNETSATFENYFLVKYTSKDYLLIRYIKDGDKIEIVNVKIVPSSLKELFDK